MKIEKPKLLKPTLDNDLEIVCGDDIKLEEECMINSIHIKDGYIEDFNCKRVYIKDCLIENVTFANNDLSNLEISNCIIKGCDFSGVRAIEAIFHKTQFLDCKMTGSIFSEGTFNSVELINLKAPYFVSRFSEFKNCSVVNCSFVNGDIQDSKLIKTEFDLCDLKGLNLLNVNLKGMDLRSSNIDEISVLTKDIMGVMVTTAQAIDLTRLLGLIISDEQ